MDKVSFFQATEELGPAAIPLFGPADSYFEKTASAQLLPEVANYIAKLRPRNDAQYVLVNAMGAGEYYGCFPAGTLVETADGEVPIEEVAPGALALTHRNRFRQVLARVPKQAHELCDLYVRGLPKDLPALTATPNHELWVVAREDFLRASRKHVWFADTARPLGDRRLEMLRALEFSWAPISELRAGDYIAEPFPLDEDPAALGDERWNTPEVAFLMGLYAAEGCISYRYDRADELPASIIYVIGGHEGPVLERARACAYVLSHGLQDYPSDTGTSSRLQLCFADLARVCREHIGTPAVDKKLSSALLRMPREWQRTFFDAYAAGDGCVRKSGADVDTIRCTSASADLLRGMRILLARLGLASAINGRHNKKATWYSGRPIFELSVSGGQLREEGGRPRAFLHPDGYILSAVTRTETYAWSGVVYDLTVEEDSSFVASGVAVHNSNINGDRFAEAALIHRPDGWKGIPQVDALLARDWPYGFPTFYNAHVYPHHRNKDSSKALGVVELAAWNPHMKRVELVTRLDQDKCARHGGQAIWDKLRHATEFPDVSMGTKVPFDTCSITLDRNLYQKAWQTFDPAKHKSPGDAILAFHKKLKAENGVGIRGVSITRKDYSEYASTMMNRILPDGRKVWVDNDFPRFFDISYVFIGADKIAKAMLKIASLGKRYFYMGGAEAAELARTGELEEKLASAEEGPCKAAEISKEVVPNSLAAKAVPVLTEREQDLPEEALRLLEAQPLERALATTTALGVVLRPAEFQRIVLVQAGKRPLSQSLAGLNQLFPRTEEKEELSFSSKDFSSSLAEALAPLLLDRSAFGPVIEHRVVVVRGKPPRENLEKSSHSSELLRKIGAAYNGYRDTLMQVVADAQDMLGGSQGASPLRKLASAQVTTLFTPLSFHYLRDAFMDEIPEDKEAAVRAIAGVQRGSPLVTTR